MLVNDLPARIPYRDMPGPKMPHHAKIDLHGAGLDNLHPISLRYVKKKTSLMLSLSKSSLTLVILLQGNMKTCT